MLLKLYNIVFILFYFPSLLLAFILTRLSIVNRQTLQYFGFGIEKNEKVKKSVWFHCASIGETKSIKPLIDSIKREIPDITIIVTTITLTGYETALKENIGNIHFLLPIENSFILKKLLKNYNVKAFFIVETELWPNLIKTVSRNCKLYLINGRISKKSYRKYILFKKTFSNLLQKFNTIYAKSLYDKEIIATLANTTSNIKYIGNIKLTNRKPLIDETIISSLNGKKIFFIASTHKKEEAFFLDCTKNFIQQFDHIIIAPRHIKRIKEIENLMKSQNIKYTLLSKQTPFEKFIIVDRFGLLETFYSISDKIFIGGSLIPIGGHNIYEALQFKKIISTGPFMDNFRDIFELAVKYKLLYIIKNKDDLMDYLFNTYKNNPSFDLFFNEFINNNNKIMGELKNIVIDATKN